MLSIPAILRYKTELSTEIDGMKDFTQQMVDQVFSFGELGFQEVETSKYLTGILQKATGSASTDAVAGNPDRRGPLAGGAGSRSSPSVPT